MCGGTVGRCTCRAWLPASCRVCAGGPRRTFRSWSRRRARRPCLPSRIRWCRARLHRRSRSRLRASRGRGAGLVPGTVLQGSVPLAMGVGRLPQCFESWVEADEPGPGRRSGAAVSLGQPQVSRCDFWPAPTQLARHHSPAHAYGFSGSISPGGTGCRHPQEVSQVRAGSALSPVAGIAR